MVTLVIQRRIVAGCGPQNTAVPLSPLVRTYRWSSHTSGAAGNTYQPSTPTSASKTHCCGRRSDGAFLGGSSPEQSACKRCGRLKGGREHKGCGEPAGGACSDARLKSVTSVTAAHGVRTVMDCTPGPGLSSFGYGAELARPGSPVRSRCFTMRMCTSPSSTAAFSSLAVVTSVASGTMAAWPAAVAAHSSTGASTASSLCRIVPVCRKPGMMDTGTPHPTPAGVLPRRVAICGQKGKGRRLQGHSRF